MVQFNIAEAKAHFSELIRKALLGEDVVIAKDNKPLLRLVPLQVPGNRREPGTAKGQILWVADDFDETPEGFEDHTTRRLFLIPTLSCGESMRTPPFRPAFEPFFPIRTRTLS
jgi:prevent-host-death family protein